ncbi:MAG: glycosyltransferase family 9 protein [Deltaproteobacteria bacterium]|nr:glycosyltransferase family 9 protein [Deltaproteobacteria bacterium]
MAKRPWHSRIRRSISKSLNAFLCRIINTKIEYDRIDANGIKRILLIRLNHRIGNILFLTPLIKALEKKIPHAQIDLLLGADFSELIGRMANVNKIYCVNSRLIKNPFRLITLIKELNKNGYDLTISPAKSSGSSNILQASIKSRYKLSFKVKDVINFANIVVDFPDIKHAALLPLALMDAFDGERLTYEPYLDISLFDDEKARGKEILTQLIGQDNINGMKIIGIFRNARYEKKIADSFWLEYINKLLETGHGYIFVDIIAPGGKAVSDDVLSISFVNLRELASFMAALDFFICADTGPMHLASAAKTDIIALFNKTSPEAYGPLGKNDRVIDINNKSLDEVLSETVSIIHK